MQVSSENPFFKGLTRAQVNLLIPLFTPFTAPSGTVVFKQGDEATHLYVIQRGAVTIQYKPYDGPIITLSHLEAGEIFGWSSVVGAQTYTSDAICITELESLRLRGADLVQLCAHHPTAGYAILEKLAEGVSPRWTYAKVQIQEILESRSDTGHTHTANH